MPKYLVMAEYRPENDDETYDQTMHHLMSAGLDDVDLKEVPAIVDSEPREPRRKKKPAWKCEHPDHNTAECTPTYHEAKRKDQTL